MFRRLARMIAISAALGICMAVTASAQDFQQSYPLSPGGSIRIGNVSGDVSVSGYDGNVVIVTATKQGSNPEMVTIEDRSSGNSVDVGVHYPRNCHNCDVSVDFQVQVPRSVSFNFDRIHTVSGNVNITGVNGKLEAASVSGTVRVTDVAGSVNAKSVSGNVEVDLNRLDGNEDMSFTSVSGDVTVKVPAGLNANIDMSSFSGTVDTNLPLQVAKREFTGGQHASGAVGSGGSRRLHMSSVSGSLSLRQL